MQSAREVVGFDLDRGAICRTLPGGSWIGMYRDNPGVFYYPTGEEATLEQARVAGFDVEGLLREREKNERIGQAKVKIEQEYAAARERIEQGLEEASTQPIESEEDSGLVRIERGSPEGGPGQGRGHVRQRYSVVESTTGRMLMKDVTRKDAEAYAQEVNARGYVTVSDIGQVEQHP